MHSRAAIIDPVSILGLGSWETREGFFRGNCDGDFFTKKHAQRARFVNVETEQFDGFAFDNQSDAASHECPAGDIASLNHHASYARDRNHCYLDLSPALAFQQEVIAAAKGIYRIFDSGLFGKNKPFESTINLVDKSGQTHVFRGRRGDRNGMIFPQWS